jgi:hypothetical protein
MQTISGACLVFNLMGTGALTPGVKEQGCKVDHSLLSSSKVKNAWSYLLSPKIHLHGIVFN